MEEDQINKVYKVGKVRKARKVRIQLIDDVQVNDVMSSWGNDGERSEPL